MDHSDAVESFFRAYEEASNAADAARIALLFAEVFLLAGPNGSQVVRKADFLAALPKRHAHFKTLGLAGTALSSLEHAPMDEHYVTAQAGWSMHFVKDGEPVEVEVSSSFLLYRRGETYEIVLYLPHGDVQERLREAGLT